MPALTTKLRCASWEQLASLYEREIKVGRLFLRSSAPPADATDVAVDLTLPSGTIIPLSGRVTRVVESGPRGAGVELVLTRVPPSTLWLIESALQAAQRRSGSVSAIPTPLPEARASGPIAAPFTDDTTYIGDDAPEVAEDISVEVADDSEAASAESELIVALDVELGGMRGQNPFQVLGISYQATDEQVRTAFNELVKRTHPDRFARFESERARALAAEMFVLVREAYGKVSDAPARAALAARLRPPASPLAPGPGDSSKPIARVALTSRPEPPRPPPPPPRPLSADDLFGDLGSPAPARGAVPVAIEPEGSGAYPEAERLLASGQADRAFALYDEALRRKPGDRAARLGRELAAGLRQSAAGDRGQAAHHFESALELDPLNELASRELTAIRRAATESRKGILSKLLGRKT